MGHNSNGKVNQGTTHVEARERIKKQRMLEQGRVLAWCQVRVEHRVRVRRVNAMVRVRIERGRASKSQRNEK